MKRNEITQGINEADKHSFVGKIQRGHELKKKVDQTWVDTGAAQKRGDHPEASRSFRKHERYANLERPGTWTKVKDEGIGDTVRRAVKSVKRGMQGWGTDMPGGGPKDIVKRNKSYTDSTIKDLSQYTRPAGSTEKYPEHSPRGLQQRVVGREMKKRGLANEGEATPGYIKYEQMKNKIASVLIKLYDQGKDLETIKQMGARIATHLGYDPEDETFQDAFISSFADASLDGAFDQEEEDDYTDYSMRQGEMGRRGEGLGEEMPVAPIAPGAPATQAKITGVTDTEVTLQKAPGVEIKVDPKANPTALSKGPDGKLVLNTKPVAGTQQGGMAQNPIKVGATVTTPEAVNRIAAGGHSHGDELNTTGTESPISGDEAADNYNERLRKLAGL